METNKVKLRAIEKILTNTGIKYTVEAIADKSKTEVTTNQIIAVVSAGKATVTNLNIDTNSKTISEAEEIPVRDNRTSIKKDLDSIEDLSDIINPSSEPSTPEEKIARIKILSPFLANCKRVYFKEDNEIIDNFTYDRLIDELEALEEETGFKLPNSPTAMVGYTVSEGLQKKKHTKKMLSLKKTKEISELIEFLAAEDGVLSFKNDGLTVVLEYNNGELNEAVTRGNGEIGEVVTDNAKQFSNLPLKISFKGHLVLRGEAIITQSSFEKIKSTPEGEAYKNARNLCSGTVRQLNSKIVADRDVKWNCFRIVEYDTLGTCDDEFPALVDEQFKWLKSLGFDIVDYCVVNKDNLQEAIDKFTKEVTENNYDVPVDGLVLTYRKYYYGLSLGETATTPRHSIAFKWGDTVKETKIIDVVWQTSRQGLITPVAVFEPTEIEGSTVSRATLHNVSIFKSLELGKGDIIGVYKANMIIPKIAYNKTRSNTFTVPTTCASCGHKTVIRIEPKSGVKTLWCENTNCTTQGNKKLEHFVKRDAMNIIGVSGATIEALVNEGLLETFSDFYNLEEHRYEIECLEGFGETSADNLLEAIEKSRKVKLSNLIYALGIPNIGLATAKLICKKLTTPQNILNADYSDLMSIDGIGETLAISFVDYFSDTDNCDEFLKLLEEVELEPEESQLNTSMSGVVICVTGDVYRFSSRRVIKDLVEKLGGKLTGSVSRSTSYLVTNDTESGSNKNKAAKSYGIPILTEDEFIEKFNLEQYL